MKKILLTSILLTVFVGASGCGHMYHKHGDCCAKHEAGKEASCCKEGGKCATDAKSSDGKAGCADCKKGS